MISSIISLPLPILDGGVLTFSKKEKKKLDEAKSLPGFVLTPFPLTSDILAGLVRRRSMPVCDLNPCEIQVK